MAGRLQGFCRRYAGCFRTATRDASPYAAPYVGALLRMDGKRTFANIGRQVGLAGQNVQHFVSNSPWSAAGVLRQVRREIAARPELRRGGVLILDESPVKKAGTKTAGAARRWNGRIGHVDLSQVGTFLACANGPVWAWVDGGLFLPERWLGPELAEERKRLGIPAERTFKTKVELGWEMIQRVQREGLPFEAIGCDELYGRSGWLRARPDEAKLVYLANVPADTRVYLDERGSASRIGRLAGAGRRSVAGRSSARPGRSRPARWPPGPMRPGSGSASGPSSAGSWPTSSPPGGSGRSATTRWPRSGCSSVGPLRVSAATP